MARVSMDRPGMSRPRSGRSDRAAATPDCLARGDLGPGSGIKTHRLSIDHDGPKEPVSIHDKDLEQLAPDLLRRCWRSLMGKAAPATMSVHLMARILIWKEQALQEAALDAEVRAILQAAGGDRRGVGSPASAPSRRLKPGTVLTRDYAGITHRVMVLADGYTWNGRTFKSLSEVAKAVTGTQWNGLVFFGLKKRKSRMKEATATCRAQTSEAFHLSPDENSKPLPPVSDPRPDETIEGTSLEDADLHGARLQDKALREAPRRPEGSVP